MAQDRCSARWGFERRLGRSHQPQLTGGLTYLSVTPSSRSPAPPLRCSHVEPARCRAVVDTRLRAAHRPGDRELPDPSRRGRRRLRDQGRRHQHRYGARQSRLRLPLEDPHRRDLHRGVRAHPGPRPPPVVDRSADAARAGLLLLLVPPGPPRHPDPVGLPCRPPLQPEVQPQHRAAPALDESHRLAVLSAAHRVRSASRRARLLLIGQPRLPVLGAHRADRQAAAALRVRTEHALPPPGAPRLPRRLPGPELRRDPHPVGPAVRVFRTGDRAARLRAHQEHRDVQPAAGRDTRVRGHREEVRAASTWGERAGRVFRGPGWQPAATRPAGAPLAETAAEPAA